MTAVGIRVLCGLGLILFGMVFVLAGTSVHPEVTPTDKSPPDLRPAVRVAVGRIRELPIIGLTQTTDSAQLVSEAARIRAPAAFPASTYRLAFGDSTHQVAFVANAEMTLAHHFTVDPGVTRLKGCVTLEGWPTEPSHTCLTDDELEYLLVAIYGKFCAKLSASDGAALNRFKDAVLAIRFGQKPGAQVFHERRLKNVTCQ